MSFFKASGGDASTQHSAGVEADGEDASQNEMRLSLVEGKESGFQSNSGCWWPPPPSLLTPFPARLPEAWIPGLRASHLLARAHSFSGPVAFV